MAKLKRDSRLEYILKRISKEPASKLVEDMQIQCMGVALDMLMGAKYNGAPLAKRLLLHGNTSPESWEYPVKQAASAEERAASALKKAVRRLPKLEYSVEKYTDALAQSRKVKAEERIERFTLQLAIDTNALAVCREEIAEIEKALSMARLRTAVVSNIAKRTKTTPARVVEDVYDFLSPEKAEEYIQLLGTHIRSSDEEQP